MKRTRTQSDHRIVEEADYKGYHVRVVCGHSIREDVYYVHLYLTPPGGPEVRVFDPPRSESNLDDALNLAFFVAQSEVDQLVP
jgi:hypothetical protein